MPQLGDPWDIGSSGDSERYMMGEMDCLKLILMVTLIVASDYDGKPHGHRL